MLGHLPILNLPTELGSKPLSASTRMSKTDAEEMIEIEIDEREKQACLEEG